MASHETIAALPLETLDDTSPETPVGDMVEVVPWKDGPDGRSQSLDFDPAGKSGPDHVASLSLETLDELACRSAGIEPRGWRFRYEWRTPGGEWHEEESAHRSQGALDAAMRERLNGIEYRNYSEPEGIYLPVSTDPAACARLKAQLPRYGLHLDISRWADGEVSARILFEGQNRSTGWLEGDAEKIAVTRAVVAWGADTGRITEESLS